MQDILIRNVSKQTVAAIEDQAYKNRMSREAYIRTLLDIAALAPELQEKENQYSADLQRVIGILDAQQREISQILHLLKGEKAI